MSQRKFFLLAFILCVLIVEFTTAIRYHNNEEDDSSNSDDEYHLLKRLFFQESNAVSTNRPPSVLDNLVHPSSTGKTQIATQKSTYSPSYSTSSACALNPCEHGGICIPKGQLTYECRCVGPWRGIHCGIADACYRLPCQNGGTCLNVHDDYWCQCTNEYYGTNCQSKYYSSSNTENQCRPYICNTGQCISLSTTYYCQCPNDRYGEHCEKRFNKRNLSSAQSRRDLSQQLKRNLFKKNMRNQQSFPGNDNAAYYDAKNGIYF
ncbi:unnamed protein product [Adineta steineri]|uniref:EGF-like domain-containing protein n=2 Tax=Adineta steineri TaxID=433720 RepID=A0A814ACF0_9BILA|nr:unnamed protein product [Adineta steineri]CAF3825032.1 unnamed protein product [Adineta steineri]